MGSQIARHNIRSAATCQTQNSKWRAMPGTTLEVTWHWKWRDMLKTGEAKLLTLEGVKSQFIHKPFDLNGVRKEKRLTRAEKTEAENG